MRSSPEQSGHKRLSLSRRLVAVVLAAVGTGMIVSAAVSVWQQSVLFAEGRRDVLLATAHAFSAAAASAAASRDPSGAVSAIRAIGNLPDIRYAEVKAADGTPLATLGSTARLVGDLDLDGRQSVFDLFTSRTVSVSAPIVHGGQPAGRLILIGGTEGLWGRLIATVATTAFGGLVALIVGLMVSWGFQRGITRPLQQLVAAMARVRKHHTYDVALEDAGDREVGVLIDGFNAMLSDIRERDLRLDAHRRNLEQEVADRTRDLREARDAAEAANRAKSDFLATMSHEIRTPMNGIMVMAELLTQAEMPPRQRRCAEVIANSGHSLLAIINDILDFSKIEAGKLDLENVPFEVAQLGDTVVSLFAERARSKGLDLAALVDPATPRTIAGDPVRLTQIVSNLVNNALKFTERGFVHVVIGPQPGHPDVLSIAVSDTGVGIPADKRATIFDAFSQADQSTTRQYGGTGLGLAICKRLVGAMGGHIDVVSEPGKGSRFTVTVPLATSAARPRDWPRMEDGAEAFCVIDLAGDATVATATRYFSAFGYTVVPGGNANNAALVCVDAARLVATGLQRRQADGPLVIAVADFGDTSADRLVEGGFAAAILTKPLLRADVEELLLRIAAGTPLVPREAEAQRSSEPQFAGLNVLVADDSAVNREVAVAALARLGAIAHTVENGTQAIIAVRNATFDVVLMDGSMPDVDGFAATRRIRAEEQSEGRRRLPIVALTAHVIGTSANAWRDADMDDVVYKPYTLAQLRACFQRLFPDWADASAGARAISLHDVPETRDADTDGDSLLDAGIFQELQEIDGPDSDTFVWRVFGLYMDHAPRVRDQLALAFRDGDREECARAAHALKSMSHNIGARAVAASVEAIERCARETGMPEAAELDELNRLLDATLARIGAKLDDFPATSAATDVRSVARQS
jgi:signal transduction histidine kinase/CheY-like chemotaxis protein/HPt (histidine-containing phosphotransfer) domain-containing protein